MAPSSSAAIRTPPGLRDSGEVPNRSALHLGWSLLRLKFDHSVAKFSSSRKKSFVSVTLSLFLSSREAPSQLPTPRHGAVCYSAPRHRNDERDNATCYVTMRALEIRIDVTRAMATITIRQSPRPRPRPRRPRPSASATPPAARHKLYHVNRMWRSGRMFLR